MKLGIIKQYWEEAIKLSSDLQEDQKFSTSQFIVYLKEHLSDNFEEMTKTKVNYLRIQSILKPEESGEGEIRTSWQYTTTDVRRAILVELLKARENLSVQKSKVWLQSLEEAQNNRGMLYAQEAQDGSQEITIPAPPSPVSSVYALLRNRVLGTLITSLGFGEADVTPPECFIAIHVLNHIPKTPPMKKVSWERVQNQLDEGVWLLAASDSFKLYVYPDLQQLQKNRSELTDMLPQYHWYSVVLLDIVGQYYEILLGLSESQNPSITVLQKALERRLTEASFIQLDILPGLSTLLRAAFVNQSSINKGTTLYVLAEIIATASDAWDYCMILLPKASTDTEAKSLYFQESSSTSPLQLRGKSVETGQSLSGWCYHYRQRAVIEPTAQNDSRLALYEEMGHPTAVAAIPAIATDQGVVGVIYVARCKPIKENEKVFTQERLASLEAFGYICGDVIAREEIEIETVRSMGRLATRSLRPLLKPFHSLEDMLQEVAGKVRRGVSPEQVAHSWIYLLTLNVQTSSQDTITQWLCQQGEELTGNFLAYRLRFPSLSYPLPIGRHKVKADQCVFAILQAVDMPEEIFKKGITDLQKEIDQIRIGRSAPDFYPSTVTFRFEDLHELFTDYGQEALVSNLYERTRESLIAGPYFKRGHEALYTADLDQAVSEFENALRYVPQSWYGHKHLAEARMLQGTDTSIKQAIENSGRAIKLNPKYASAHCLLADCLAYQGNFVEALAEYERAIEFDSTRSDFLIRYGLTLAGISPTDYQKLIKHLPPNSIQTELDMLPKQPWQAAIDKFDRARNLGKMYDAAPTKEQEQEQRAKYHYQRGYAYLQASMFDKAVEDFTVGRKLDPDDLQLAQAYSYALSLRRKEQTA